jgi:hypothetical protein
MSGTNKGICTAALRSANISLRSATEYFLTILGSHQKMVRSATYSNRFAERRADLYIIYIRDLKYA